MRIIKAMVLAYGLTLLNIIPQFILHFVVPPLPPILPIIGGYLAGERYSLSAWESSLVGLLAAVVVGLPLPLAYLLGFWGYMAPLFIGFLAIFGAVYCGFIIGGMAYIGGDSARRKRARLAPAAAGRVLPVDSEPAVED